MNTKHHALIPIIAPSDDDIPITIQPAATDRKIDTRLSNLTGRDLIIVGRTLDGTTLDGVRLNNVSFRRTRSENVVAVGYCPTANNGLGAVRSYRLDVCDVYLAPHEVTTTNIGITMNRTSTYDMPTTDEKRLWAQLNASIGSR